MVNTEIKPKCWYLVITHFSEPKMVNRNHPKMVNIELYVHKLLKIEKTRKLGFTTFSGESLIENVAYEH